MKHTMLILTLILTGCGKPGADSSASALSTKPAFSEWYTADGSVLDLRGLSFGTVVAVFPIRQYGITYSCQTTVISDGNEQQGTVQVQSSVPVNLGAGQYTTACADIVATYDFVRNSDGMQIGRRGSRPLQYY